MYQECINYYVRNVRNKKNGNLLSISTQEQRALELKEFCDIVTQTLTPENLDVTLAEYKQSLSGKYLPDTLSRRISHAREFAEAITKGDIIIMNDNITDIQDMDLAKSEGINQEVIQPEANSGAQIVEAEITGSTALEAENDSTQESQIIPVNAPKRNAGRPKRSDGIENRNNRFNLQLQPSLRKNLDILAEYDNCSATDIISRILEQYINRRIDDINYMTQIKRDIEMRKANQAGNETY